MSVPMRAPMMTPTEDKSHIVLGNDPKGVVAGCMGDCASAPYRENTRINAIMGSGSTIFCAWNGEGNGNNKYSVL